jgi:hypothetical protein
MYLWINVYHSYCVYYVDVGTCRCSSPFEGVDTSTVDIQVAPNLTCIANGGVCDPVEEECDLVDIFGGVFVDSGTLKCKLLCVKVRVIAILICECTL